MGPGGSAVLAAPVDDQRDHGDRRRRHVGAAPGSGGDLAGGQGDERQCLVLRGHMMTGKAQLITFSQPGLYRFTNRVVKMGPEMEAKTIGRDNTLRLTVLVR